MKVTLRKRVRSEAGDLQPESQHSLRLRKFYQMIHSPKRIYGQTSLNHRSRFRLHTRSVKQSQVQFKKLRQRWRALPPIDSS
jgi:hypothetical protein